MNFFKQTNNSGHVCYDVTKCGTRGEYHEYGEIRELLYKPGWYFHSIGTDVDLHIEDLIEITKKIDELNALEFTNEDFHTVLNTLYVHNYKELASKFSNYMEKQGIK